MSAVKVLVVSHNSFSRTSNNGKTLEAIFSDFSKDEVAQLYFSNNELPDYTYCDRYFKITDMDVLRKILFLSKTCGSIPAESSLRNVVGDKAFSFFKKKFKKAGFLRDLLWLSGVWKTKDLNVWCHEYSPDFIFYLGGDAAFSHRIAAYLSDKLNVPLVSYFTDDYIINSKPRNLFSWINSFFLRRTFRKTVDMSSLLYVIGVKMAGVYSSYFGRDFKFIMNSVEYLPYVEPCHAVDSKFNVGYFGGLHLGRGEMILRFARLTPANIVIHLYTGSDVEPELYHKFVDAGVEFHGLVDSEVIAEKMKQFDFLLHVESDDSRNVELTKLSVSTKLPEYLISGRPVLVFAPSGLASVDFIVENHIGYFLDSLLPDHLVSSTLEDIIGNYESAVDVGKKGHSFVCKNLLRDVVSKKFKSDICNLFLEGN
ncbi:hypothetical protein [Pseudomonas fluvialis]|uniref:hypothetical protein n=1 Tax=Pseudomonas fluvialis TaxID=1793966 RepID=UPI0012FEE13F|nr:hypothetical protein [Pseudomonas pharmacofabricae]